MSVDFLLTALVVVLIPGTGVLYTLATGLTRGGAASVAAAFGCTLGIVPHMLAAITGLAALLHTSALAFQGLKYAGVAYLLYMAWKTLRDKGTLDIDDAAQDRPSPRSKGRIITTAILINILNPKLSLFFLAFLPQFLAVGEPQPLMRMLEMSATFMALTFAVFVLYGAGAAGIRRHLTTRPGILTWMRRSFAGAFAALGLKLALEEGR